MAYNKDRVIPTPMGHGVNTMWCVDSTTIIQLSVKWAATGKVTIPAGFPDAKKSKTAPDEMKN